jgi:hypothetical protein
MHATIEEKHTITRIYVNEAGFGVKSIDVEALIRAAKEKSLLTLQAGAESEGLREVTAEEIVELTRAAGGTAEIVYDEAGEISEVHATGCRDICEYSADEIGEVLESLQATGTLPKKLTGDLAQTSVGSTLNITGSTTTGSAVITAPSSIVGLAIGNPIAGAGIPVGATVTILSPLTISAVATATAAGITITVEAEQQVIGLAEWTLDWKRKTAEATTTDDSAYESSLGSTASWSAKAKYMFLVGDSSQANAITAAITTAQAPQVWNFFPDVTVGHPAYSGFAFIDGITIAAGTGKIVGLDVSLKGTGPLTVGIQIAPAVQTSTITALEAEV